MIQINVSKSQKISEKGEWKSVNNALIERKSP